MSNHADKRRFITGLDLGQAKDFTAMIVLERSVVPAADAKERRVVHYAVRHIERFALGTSYMTICDKLMKLFGTAPLTGTMLAVDETGVGRPVVDMLGSTGIKASLRAITITGGHAVHYGGNLSWKVPKKCLVSSMQVLLQSRRLTMAKQLPLTAILVEELLNFQVKITDSANETFGTWREGRHDDLVLAVAIAAWAGENLDVGRWEFL